MLFWKTSQHLSHNVLDSFGIMNEKLENANSNSYHELTLDEERILKHQSQKKQKQGEEIIKASNELYNYIENLKVNMLAEVNMTKDSMDFSVMDKPSVLLFKDGRVIGNAFILHINTYRIQMAAFAKTSLNEEFNIYIQNSFKTKHLNTTDWLSYEFNDFPVIATYTKLTAMQNDIKKAQSILNKRHFILI